MDISCSNTADSSALLPIHCLVSALQLPFDEVESVEFARQGGGVVSSRTFDLVVRMKNDVEHQFRFVWGQKCEGA